MSNNKNEESAENGTSDLIASLGRQIETLIGGKRELFAERDMCVCLIARMAMQLGYNAGLATDDTKQPGFRNVVYIDLPSGQVSWHIRNSELHWFDFLKPYAGAWDKHTDKEKYDRVLSG